MTEQVDYRKAFFFHGVQLQLRNSQLQGDCPLCGKEQHLFVKPNDGKYKCHHCGESGNYHTFLNKLYELEVSKSLLEPLAQRRGMKLPTFLHAGLTVNALTEDILIPSYNEKERLCNLYKVQEEAGKLRIYSSPSPCQQSLYRINTIRKQPRVYVCEGHWDTLCLVEVLAHLEKRGDRLVLKGRPNYESELLKENAVVGVPGATTFKDSWKTPLRGKEVILLYDNDEAGEKGMEKVISAFTDPKIRPSSLQRIRWREGDPNDVNDLLRDGNHLKVYNQILERLEPVDLAAKEAEEDEIPDLEAVPCESFQELVEKYKQNLHWTKNIETTLACMLAVTLSTTTKGGQLGLRVIGPPASCKSTLAECLAYSREYVYPRSKFTGIVSGWHNVSKSKMLAAKMNGKCVVIKEADTLMQLPNLPQIESEIRDVLGDGVIRVEYRTGKEIEIETLFTMILCGTKALRRSDDSILGSRFLDCVIHEEHQPGGTAALVQRAINSQFLSITNALSNTGDDKSIKETILRLAPLTRGFLQHKKGMLSAGSEITIPPQEIKDYIHAMAELTSYCRAKVDRDRDRNIRYRPEKELATRLAEQLTRLGIFLAICLQPGPTYTIDDAVLKILKKVTQDTSLGFTLEVLLLLRENPRGLNREQLAVRMGLSPTQAWNILQDLLELRIVTKEGLNNGKTHGRNSHYYRLTDHLQQLVVLIFGETRAQKT